MARSYTDPTIDEYLRKRLMSVEGVIPRLPGIDMYEHILKDDERLRQIGEQDRIDETIRRCSLSNGTDADI